MSEDPTYVRHLGESGTLRNFVGGAYYQTAWEDFQSHEEIWEDYIKHATTANLEPLVRQIERLLARSPEDVHQFLRDAIGSGGLYFRTPQDAVDWLKSAQAYLSVALVRRTEPTR